MKLTINNQVNSTILFCGGEWGGGEEEISPYINKNVKQ
jgi:hypothetical protein